VREHSPGTDRGRGHVLLGLVAGVPGQHGPPRPGRQRDAGIRGSVGPPNAAAVTAPARVSSLATGSSRRHASTSLRQLSPAAQSGRDLDVSEGTVKGLVSRLMTHLDRTDRTQPALLAARNTDRL
jgi:hypothetical protein